MALPYGKEIFGKDQQVQAQHRLEDQRIRDAGGEPPRRGRTTMENPFTPLLGKGLKLLAFLTLLACLIAVIENIAAGPSTDATPKSSILSGIVR